LQKIDDEFDVAWPAPQRLAEALKGRAS